MFFAPEVHGNEKDARRKMVAIRRINSSSTFFRKQTKYEETHDGTICGNLWINQSGARGKCKPNRSGVGGRVGRGEGGGV